MSEQTTPKRMRRYWFIALGVAVCLVAFCSAVTYFVSQERDSIVRAAESGSATARLLLEGANFWQRYFIFCTIALAVALHGWRRLLGGTFRGWPPGPSP